MHAIFPLLATASNEAMMKLDSKMLWTLWSGIIVYVSLMLFIGWWASRKIHSMSDFLVAGRKLPLWMATATLLATWFGAGSSMGVAATVYSGDLRDVLADPFGASVSLVLAGIFVVGALRKMKCMTVTDILQKRYGNGVGIYASLWMIPVYVGWLGAQVIGVGVLLNLLTGINMFYSQIIGGAIILIYTVTGGMWAVTITDVIQVVLVVSGLLFILPGALQMAGGVDAVFNSQLDLSLLPKNPSACSGSDWINYTGNWIIMGLGCMVGQDLLQRSLASKNEQVAISSSILSGIFYMSIALVPITIGLAAKILLPQWGITLESMGGIEGLENQVMPRIAIGVLGQTHPILLTLFISALISAIMSSADSSLLAASSLLVNNVISPFFPQMKDKSRLFMTRIATICLLIFSTFIAMNVESIYNLMINCWASQLVIIFIPVIAAIYLKKSSGYTIWISMISGTVIWILYVYVWGIADSPSVIEAIGTDKFNYELTNGAVYGFLAALGAFVTSYMGERITERFHPSNSKEI